MRTGAACTLNPVTVGPEDTIVEAARKMRDEHVGSLVVVDDGVPVGMLTDRDIAVCAVAQAADRIGSLIVSDLIPGGEIHFAYADEPVWKTVKRMRDRGVRRMPVVEDGVLVGVFSIDDAIPLIAEQLEDLSTLLRQQATHEWKLRGPGP